MSSSSKLELLWHAIHPDLPVSAELEAAIRDVGKECLAELLWYAIQRNDLKAVATFTKFINGMRDGSCE